MATKAHSPPSATSKRPDATCILSDRLPLAPWRVILSCGALDARDVTRLSSCSRTCLSRGRREDVWAALCKHVLAVGAALPGAPGGLTAIFPENYITTDSNKPSASTRGNTGPCADTVAEAVTFARPPPMAISDVMPTGTKPLAGAGGLGHAKDAAIARLPAVPESCTKYRELCVHPIRQRRFAPMVSRRGAVIDSGVPKAVCKALVLGPLKSGKCSLLRCVMNDCKGVPSPRGYHHPIGVDFVVREVEAKPLREHDDVSGPDGDPLRVKVQLWRDYNAWVHARYGHSSMLLRGCDCVGFTYNLSDASNSLREARAIALDALTVWNARLAARAGGFIDVGVPQLCVLATYCDKEEGLMPEPGDDAHAFAAELAACSMRPVPVLAVNSTSGEGVREFADWVASVYAVQTNGMPEGYVRATGSDGGWLAGVPWGCSVM